MSKRLTAALAIVIGTSVTMLACHDQTSFVAPERGSPAAAPASPSFHRHGESETSLVPLRRSVDVPDGTSWSFVVGTTATVSRNTAAGLTVVVPRGAAPVGTTITVTAVGGSLVAYRFEPHGLHFSRPVILVQNLNGISGVGAGPFGVAGGYFTGDEPVVDPESHRVTVAELEPTFANDRAHIAVMAIVHFSGYIFASGRGGGFSF